MDNVDPRHLKLTPLIGRTPTVPEKGPTWDPAVALAAYERDELVRLRRENRQLRLERDILSKAAVWFARETGTLSIGYSGSRARTRLFSLLLPRPRNALSHGASELRQYLAEQLGQTLIREVTAIEFSIQPCLLSIAHLQLRPK